MWIIACLFALLAVALGALGSHALKASLSASSLAAWQTAVHYQMFHSLALLVISIEQKRAPSLYLKRAAYFFIGGIICFSGSIFLLSSKSLHIGDVISFLGPVTPIGGICFLVAWVLCILHATNNKYE